MKWHTRSWNRQQRCTSKPTVQVKHMIELAELLNVVQFRYLQVSVWLDHVFFFFPAESFLWPCHGPREHILLASVPLTLYNACLTCIIILCVCACPCVWFSEKGQKKSIHLLNCNFLTYFQFWGLNEKKVTWILLSSKWKLKLVWRHKL